MTTNDMQIAELSNLNQIIKISASGPLTTECAYFRIVVTPVMLKTLVFQAVQYGGKKVFHTNIHPQDLEQWCANNVVGKYKQVCVVLPQSDVTYLTSSSGVTKRLCKQTQQKNQSIQSNNRRKNYILNEGDDIPAFVDLGVFTKENKVVNSMFDKFKQINRFVEILDDYFKNCNKKQLTLLDFGCGKSYLTFFAYHYFTKVRKLDVTIVGYDLKEDVVAKCNALAKKYGYHNLSFVVADVTKDVLYDKHIDGVISLHACDVATDYALNYAINHNAQYVFSVPCCQHQVNATICKGGDLDVLLKYGLIKERASALLTDSVRALILEDMGYDVDVMEFIDLTHSPKNIMLRATLKRKKSFKNRPQIEKLQQTYGFSHQLYSLVCNPTVKR